MEADMATTMPRVFLDTADGPTDAQMQQAVRAMLDQGCGAVARDFWITFHLPSGGTVEASMLSIMRSVERARRMRDGD